MAVEAAAAEEEERPHSDGAASRRNDDKKKKQKKVAVVGAGAAGLAAARELGRGGHHVTVFEQDSRVGGVWVYNPEVEDDVLGQSPHRKRVHSSMYASLRTNLPRHIMAFSDFPFNNRTEGDNSNGEADIDDFGRDIRRFCRHEAVMRYLQDFANHFDLNRLIRFNTRVISALPIDTKGRRVELKQVQKKEADIDIDVVPDVRWRVSTTTHARALDTYEGASSDECVEEEFDALVVCNGHFSQPRLAKVPLLSSSSSFPSQPNSHTNDTYNNTSQHNNNNTQHIHSHSYRTPEPYKGKVVVIIGTGESGLDIALEIAGVAEAVYLCGRNWKSSYIKEGETWGNNLRACPLVKGVTEDGRVRFGDETEVRADFILHCTGYLYSFPFLEEANVIDVSEERVHPVYEHVFVPSVAPTLAFIGLPFKVVPFPLFESQSRWVSLVLSGTHTLPSAKHMLGEIGQLYQWMDREGRPKRFTHMLEGDMQFEYMRRLASYCSVPPPEPWRERDYRLTRDLRKVFKREYRDKWVDDLVELMDREGANPVEEKKSLGST